MKKNRLSRHSPSPTGGGCAGGAGGGGVGGLGFVQRKVRVGLSRPAHRKTTTLPLPTTPAHSHAHTPSPTRRAADKLAAHVNSQRSPGAEAPRSCELENHPPQNQSATSVSDCILLSHTPSKRTEHTEDTPACDAAPIVPFLPASPTAVTPQMRPQPTTPPSPEIIILCTPTPPSRESTPPRPAVRAHESAPSPLVQQAASKHEPVSTPECPRTPPRPSPNDSLSGTPSTAATPAAPSPSPKHETHVTEVVRTSSNPYGLRAHRRSRPSRRAPLPLPMPETPSEFPFSPSPPALKHEKGEPVEQAHSHLKDEIPLRFHHAVTEAPVTPVVSHPAEPPPDTPTTDCHSIHSLPPLSLHLTPITLISSAVQRRIAWDQHDLVAKDEPMVATPRRGDPPSVPTSPTSHTSHTSPTGVTRTVASAHHITVMSPVRAFMPPDLPLPSADDGAPDESSMEFPGFIAPSMPTRRTLSAPPQAPTLGTALSSSALAAAAAAVTLPATPISSGSTPPRTPTSLQLPAGAQTPSPNITPPRPPSPLPLPSPDFRRRVVAYWSASLGRDHLGRGLGDLLDDALETAHCTRRIPYEAYAAYLHTKLRDHPSTVLAMQMRNVTAEGLMRMYPPEEMPTPHLTWDDVTRTTPVGPWTKGRKTVTPATTTTTTSRSSTVKTKSRQSTSILDFASRTGPTAVERLVQDATRAAAAAQKPSLDDAYRAHAAQLERQPPTARHTPSSDTPDLAQGRPRASRRTHTPTRRLLDELHEAEDHTTEPLPPLEDDLNRATMRQSHVIHAVDGAASSTRASPPPPVLSDPPELERPPPLNLYSEPQHEDDSSRRMEIDPADARHEMPASKKTRAHIKRELVADGLEPACAVPATSTPKVGEIAPQPVTPMQRGMQTALMAPPSARSATGFLSPCRPPLHQAQPDASRTPLQPVAALVTISPLTATSSSSAATPSPAQRRVDTPHTRNADVAMSACEEERASHKRRQANSTERRARSKKAKPAADEPVAAPTAPVSRPAHADYHRARRRLNRRGQSTKPAGPQRGSWLVTRDGERQYISRQDGQAYSGREAAEKQREDEQAMEQRRMLKKRSSGGGVDETNAAAAVPPLPSPLHSLSAWHVPDAIAAAYGALGISSLYDWQVDCLQLPGVFDGRSNLVYSASTSAGKTLVAELLLLRRLLETTTTTIRDDGSHLNHRPLGMRKVLLVLPYVSIVDEKCRDLTAKLSRVGFCIQKYHGSQSGQRDAADAHAMPMQLNAITPEIDVAVAVIEKACMLWDHLRDEDRLGELTAVVIDELHMISNAAGEEETTQQGSCSNRGYLLELLLTKVVQYNHARAGVDSAQAPPPIQIIGMSATLPNMDLLQSWLHPCQLYHTDFRPVPLKEFMLFRNVVYQKVQNDDQSQLPAAAASTASTGPRFRFDKVRDLKPSSMNRQVALRRVELDRLSQGASATGEVQQPAALPPPVASRAALTDEERHRAFVGQLLDLTEETGGGVLVFCPFKSDVEQCARDLARAIKRRDQVRRSGVIVEEHATHSHAPTTPHAARQRTLDNMLTSPAPGAAAAVDAPVGASASSAPTHSGRDRLMLLNHLAQLSEGIDSTLERTVPHGVGYHHAGLTGDARLLVESAFRTGVLQVLCCTSTLAAGVNLPARRVIFNGPRIGRRLLRLHEYQQMSGRAGRTGLSAKGSEGSSILVVRTKDEFDLMQRMINQDLPEIKSALDMKSDVELKPAETVSSSSASHVHAASRSANLYVSHAVLDAIVALKSATRIERADIDAYLTHTLLSHQLAREEIHTTRRPAWAHAEMPTTPLLPLALSHQIDLTLAYLISHGLVDARTNCATPLGAAVCEAGFNPHEGLRVYTELKQTRSCGLSLSSALHMCWLLTTTPVLATIVTLKDVPRWELMRSRWSRMKDADHAVCRLLVLPASRDALFAGTDIDRTEYHDHVIMKCQRGHIVVSPRHAAYVRLCESMVLQDLLDDARSLRSVQRETQRSAGELHAMLRAACLRCHQLIALCESMQWRDFSLVLSSYRDRFALNGAPTELLHLLRIPELKMRRARDLYDEGITSVEQIAQQCEPTQLYDIFLKRQPYRPSTSAASAPRTTSQTRADASRRRAHNLVLMQQATRICEAAKQIMRQETKMNQSLMRAM